MTITDLELGSEYWIDDKKEIDAYRIELIDGIRILASIGGQAWWMDPSSIICKKQEPKDTMQFNDIIENLKPIGASLTDIQGKITLVLAHRADDKKAIVDLQGQLTTKTQEVANLRALLDKASVIFNPEQAAAFQSMLDQVNAQVAKTEADLNAALAA